MGCACEMKPNPIIEEPGNGRHSPSDRIGIIAVIDCKEIAETDNE